MTLKVGDEVGMTIENETPLGYNVTIEDGYEGLLYHNEVYGALEEKMKVVGFIKNIRDDGKIDVSLRPQGFENVIDYDVERVLSELHDSPNGYLLVTEKSSPDSIRFHLNMSKKAYKKALGNLYKQKLITISDDKIQLIAKKS